MISMKADNQSGGIKSILSGYSLMAFIWTILILVSMIGNMHAIREATLSSATAALRANLNKDLSIRRWATSHGGVYVPPTEHTPPNPYLKVPDRDIITMNGKVLTLMNPAYIVRQIQEEYSEGFGIQSHITSLKPLNPKNNPDDWETNTLKRFKDKGEEFVEIQQVKDKPFLRMMHPLVTESGCLKCHGFQGYKVGDVNGGLSCAVPLSFFQQHEKKHTIALALSHGLLWVTGSTALSLWYRRNRRLVEARLMAEQTLMESEERLRNMFADHSAMMLLIEPGSGKILYGNQSAKKFYGYSLHQLQTMSIDEINDLPPEQVARERQKAVDLKQNYFVFPHRLADGTIRTVEVRSSPIIFKERKLLFSIIHDITERKAAEDALRESEERHRLLVENSPMCIHEIDMHGKIISMNKAGLEMMGLKEESEVIGYAYLDSVNEADRKQIEDLILAAYSGKTSQFEFMSSADKEQYFSSCFVPIKNKYGAVEKLMGITEDITRRKIDEITLQKSAIHFRDLADYDELTKLPNRRLMDDRLSQAMIAGKRSGRYGAVMFLDLDNFKPINDNYGHIAGDLLLIEAAQRINGCVRADDTVARFGGDEFIVMLRELDKDKVESARKAGLIAEKIRVKLSEPYFLKLFQEGKPEMDIEHRCTSSIGVVLFINQESSTEDVLKCADAAMYTRLGYKFSFM
jgi:diguanylate cyclase (GGDEF)-like protein/PAS domain S-box-containing protein